LGNFGCINVYRKIRFTGNELLVFAVNLLLLNFGKISVIDISIASYVPCLL
jgi:hypothetical protein